MNRLKEARLLLIANDAPLWPEGLDHPLEVIGMVTVNVIWVVTFYLPTSWWMAPSIAWLFLFVPGHLSTRRGVSVVFSGVLRSPAKKE